MAKPKDGTFLNELENSSTINELEDMINKSQPAGMDTISLQSLPMRAYLDQTVIPILSEGLKLVATERLLIFNIGHQTQPSFWVYSS
jgi:hypothetical protein